MRWSDCTSHLVKGFPDVCLPMTENQIDQDGLCMFSSMHGLAAFGTACHLLICPTGKAGSLDACIVWESAQHGAACIKQYRTHPMQFILSSLE